MKKSYFFARCAWVICACALQLNTLSALEYYWVGGSGLWSNHNNHWATTSGGAVFHDQVPQSMDNVHFDANSFPAGGTVTIDPTIIYCMNMDWTGAGNTPVFEAPYDKQVWIYGSLKLIANMQWNIYGEVHFRAFQAGKTITSAGKAFISQVVFDGAGGGWTLLDAFHVNFYLFHLEGALYTNGQDVTVGYYFSSNGPPSRTLHFGSSNIHIGTGQDGQCGYFVMDNAPFDFDAGTSTIYMNGHPGCTQFNGGNKTYYNLVGEMPTTVYNDNNFHAATFLKNARIYGNNHYDILTFTTGQLYVLAGGSTQTINPGGTFNGSGSCMDFLTIVSTSAGNAAQIEKTTGTIALSYVVLQDIHAIGGATFSAANSADLGNNTGWTFLPVTPRDLYWVGGGGDWNATAHWSLSSGGTGGACIPTPFDNVFFDQNSGFALPGEQVNINVPVAFCQNMDWTGVSNSPDLTGAYQNKVSIFGSLKFVSGMALTYAGEVHFMAHTSGKAITSAGKAFLSSAYFDGAGGGWTLLDAFQAASLYHIDGALNTNGQDVTVTYYFSSSGSPNRALHFGSSNIYLGQNYCCGQFYMNPNPFDFDAGTSTIYFKSSSGYEPYFSFQGGNHTYYNLVSERFAYVYDNNIFHSATFLKSARIEASNIFESLNFSPGSTYELAAGSTQTITPLGNFIAQGYGGFPIEIKSTNLGIQATLHKDGDPVCLDYLYMTDIAATGTAFTYAGANSDDVFNNSGWLFQPCPDCFDAPLPAPLLASSSVTTVSEGQSATLILQNLPAGYEVVWFDAAQMTELYASTANLFQPVITQSTTFYGAFRQLTTGCVSQVLSVAVCMLEITGVTTTPETCLGAKNGTITVTATCAPLQYSINGVNYQTSNVFSGLSAGAYTVKVRHTPNPSVFDTAPATVALGGNTQDADCDGVANACDKCSGGNDMVDNNNDGKPDCKYPPAYAQIIAAWKCGNNKVYICHKPLNQANTLCVSYNALGGHMGHGDFLGPCGNASCPPLLPPGDGPSNSRAQTEDLKLSDEDLQLFPNPAQNQLFVTKKDFGGKKAVVSFTNNLGVSLLRQEVEAMPADALTLDLSGFQDGLYFLTIRVEGLSAVTKRFVIVR